MTGYKLVGPDWMGFCFPGAGVFKTSFEPGTDVSVSSSIHLDGPDTEGSMVQGGFQVATTLELAQALHTWNEQRFVRLTFDRENIVFPVLDVHLDRRYFIVDGCHVDAEETPTPLTHAEKMYVFLYGALP